jgi:hypothetical protein
MLRRWILTNFSIVEPIRYSADPNSYISPPIQRFAPNFCSSVYSKKLQSPAEPEIDKYAKLVAAVNCRLGQ